VRAAVRRDEPGRGELEEITSDEAAAQVDPEFDEAAYLRAFPDIAEAVRRGMLQSGWAHFQRTGRAEARLEKPEYRALLNSHSGLAPPQVVVDTLTLSPSGATLLTGWSDDRGNPLAAIDLQTHDDTRREGTAFPRLLRSDVERTLEAASGHRFGFMMVAAPSDRGTPSAVDIRSVKTPIFRFSSGLESAPRCEPVIASDADLRDLALGALPTAAGGDLEPDAIHRILDQHLGAQIAALNRWIVDQARADRLIEHFGPTQGRYRGSVITTSRGGADQIVPWLTLAGAGPGADEYEFIVVVTSADQFAPAWRAARVAEATLGLSLTLILQPGGDPAGNGADAALDAVRSDRLIFMDQSVLPRVPDWASRHSALLDDAPSEQTCLFGGMLQSLNGSLTNGGYFFGQETSLSPVSPNKPRLVTAMRLKAVSHPAGPRGAGPAIGVPAAFLSIDRAWFETLGGFTGQYSRAVNEDIDLCLRSRERGVSAWVHPLPMWHFDRRPTPRPEPSKGGAILNRWLLHRRWDATILSDLAGMTRPA
jgi:hypothetical protein